MRELSVRRKLNAMPAVFTGKRVLLVDDSIVRGTTMRQIVDMVRRAGATKVCRPALQPPPTPLLLYVLHPSWRTWICRMTPYPRGCMCFMPISVC